MSSSSGLTVFHIPVCPFCQRLEILLELKGERGAVRFEVIDITEPRPEWLLRKTRGTTALPILETGDGRIIKESRVILQYLEDVFPERQVGQRDAYRRAVEGMFIAMEGDFVSAGYSYVMNQDRSRIPALRERVLSQYARLNDFLVAYGGEGPFLFESFGLAETVYTPFFQRFWFLEYFEDFELPEDPRFARIRSFRDACVAHPAAQQVTKEEIVKVYYDYAKGAGNGGLLPGRTRSSFALVPDWRARPWPPRNKYEHDATDAELGLVP